MGPVAAARAGVGRTFQVVRSFDSMTVLENVMVGAFFARRAGRGPPWRVAEEVLAFCGLAGAGIDAGASADATGEAAAWRSHGRWR